MQAINIIIAKRLPDKLGCYHIIKDDYVYVKNLVYIENKYAHMFQLITMENIVQQSLAQGEGSEEATASGANALSELTKDKLLQRIQALEEALENNRSDSDNSDTEETVKSGKLLDEEGLAEERDPDIQESVVALVEKRACQQLPEGLHKQLSTKYKMPANIKLKNTKVNPEIWTDMSAGDKHKDTRLVFIVFDQNKTCYKIYQLQKTLQSIEINNIYVYVSVSG